MKEFNHQVEITYGVLEEECSELLKNFFKELRKRVKLEKKQRKEKTEKEQDKQDESNLSNCY